MCPSTADYGDGARGAHPWAGSHLPLLLAEACVQCTEGMQVADHRGPHDNHTSRFSPMISYSQRGDLLWDSSHMMECHPRSIQNQGSCWPHCRSPRTSAARATAEPVSLYCGQVWDRCRRWRYRQGPCPLGVYGPVTLEYGKCYARGKC